MSGIGTPAEGARLYGRLGLCYALLRHWQRAKGHYETMLEEARKAEDREQQWEALQQLAMLGTDYTADPESDDELFRGVKQKAEQEAEEEDEREEDEREEAESSGESELFEWSPEYALERARKRWRWPRRWGRQDLIVQGTYGLALLDAHASRWGPALEKMTEARGLFVKMGDRAMEAELLNLAAWGEVLIGRSKEAVRLGRERLSAARELGGRDFYLADLHGLVLALLETGDYEEALSVAELGAEAARSSGSSPRLYFSLLLLGDAYRILYRLKEARDTYLETTGAVNFSQYRALTHSKLCAVAAVAEDWEEAHTEASRAAALRGDMVLQLTDPLHRHHEIEALLRGGDKELAREELRRFGEAVRDNRRFRIAHLRARVALEWWEGRTGAAFESLREAEASAEEIGLPGELWQIRAGLGELYEERGEPEEARRAFAGATKTLQRLVARIEDEELRKDFLAAPQVRRVLERSGEGG